MFVDELGYTTMHRVNYWYMPTSKFAIVVVFVVTFLYMSII